MRGKPVERQHRVDPGRARATSGMMTWRTVVRSAGAGLALSILPIVPGLVGTGRAAASPASHRGAYTLAGTGEPRASGQIAASCTWYQELGPNAIVARSSPNVVDLNGSPAVVVGTESQGNAMGPGSLEAFNLATGAPVAGWPVQLPRGVWSTPTAAPTGAGGPAVFVGDGTPAESGGSYYGIGANGQVIWSYQGTDPDYGDEAVVSSLAYGDLAGSPFPSVVGGSVGLEMYALNSYNGAVDYGWPVIQADTDFSSPAIGDLQGNGQLQIVTGDDSSPGGSGPEFSWVPGDQTWAGGMVRELNAAGQTLWVFRTDEVVQSSPAVGELDGQYDVVFGTGDYWATHGVSTSDSTSLFALNAATGALVWRANLGGYTGSSPALADLYGNGQLDVVEEASLPLGVQAPGSQTEVWALNGAGQTLPGWPVTTPAGGVVGSVVTADLQGNGTQDVIVPTTEGVYVYDPQGQLIAQFGTGHESWDCPVSLPIGVQDSPLVTMDPDGQIGLTIAGYNSFGGLVLHYEISSSSGIGSGAWPQFRDNPQLTGALPAPPPACLDEAGAASATAGYWMSGGDGGIFSFGTAHFYGSLPSIGVSDPFPIVGMAPTPDGRGYWLVDSAGDVYSFGDAAFHGSLASVGVSDRMVVGVAAVPGGGGYWMVDAAGSIFSFGTAHFYGSLPFIGVSDPFPIVGMAPTPDGRGYWLVDSAGDVYSFGDAAFHGSLASVGESDRMVAGIAAAPGGGGYWIVDAAGSIFSFGTATFHGSMGGVKLNAPVIGMTVDQATGGYWLVAADGGVFSFQAPFEGSTGCLVLQRPVTSFASVP